MRTKLTAALAVLACASAVAVGSAAVFVAAVQAGPVPVAVYSFQTAGDVAAFQKQFGKACMRKWHQQKAMSIAVGEATAECVFDTSVVGDSTDPGSDMQITATAALAAGGDGKLRSRAFVGVAARSSATAGYELRVFPAAGKWQVFRDPAGAAPAVLVKAGRSKAIQRKKPSALLLRAFDFNTATTTVVAKVGAKPLHSFTDAAADAPDGRRSAVAVGVKGKGSGSGVTGIFDNVAIGVPNPS
jgi:hypothetical protein